MEFISVSKFCASVENLFYNIQVEMHMNSEPGQTSIYRATMEEPKTSTTPTKRRQNQGEVQSKSKHNKKELDAEGTQITYRSNLQAMVNLIRDLKLLDHSILVPN